MQSATRLAVSAFLVTSVVAATYRLIGIGQDLSLPASIAAALSGKAEWKELVSLCETVMVQKEAAELERERANPVRDGGNGRPASSTKLRRDGVLNLYPFPRVGRSSQSWQLPPEDLLEYTPLAKRQLYAFPRVGRGGPPSQLSLVHQLHQPRSLLHRLLQLMEARGLDRGYAKRDIDTGMWFGPRLGRPYKCNDDEDVVTSVQNNDTSEPEQTEQQLINNREKRQAK